MLDGDAAGDLKVSGVRTKAVRPLVRVRPRSASRRSPTPPRPDLRVREARRGGARSPRQAPGCSPKVSRASRINPKSTSPSDATPRGSCCGAARDGRPRVPGSDGHCLAITVRSCEPARPAIPTSSPPRPTGSPPGAGTQPGWSRCDSIERRSRDVHLGRRDRPRA